MNNEYIEVEIEADSKDHLNICKKYWTVDNDGEFEFFVKDIQNEFDLTHAELLEIVRSKSLVYSHQTECKRCGKAKYFTSRTELKKYINRSYNISRFDKPYYCEECKEIAAQERGKERTTAKSEKRNYTSGLF